jgi:hypothetical protein
MYGTVMIAKMKVSAEQLREAGAAWVAQRGQSRGYVDQWVMQADDGRVILAVRFDSKDAYSKLSDDPAQDEWYQKVMAPNMDGEPEWIDGEWLET